MDNKKILLVNLSKGKTGELNSQLLGMIFVMKFQAAAMGRANVPEDQRTDFTLYVDEFQNFATDSFETILSEARKYRLNLILANQFMTQLTDKIREAIIGNVGTVISGRIGTTDAELMVKRFAPTFDSEDLTRLPNFETIASVMINNVPSAPFSMSLIPPLGQPNPQLATALKRLSAAKYGTPRADAEKQIFQRLRAGDAAREAKKKALMDAQGVSQGSSGSSFLDEWLAKRRQLQPNKDKAAGSSSPKPNAPLPAKSASSAQATPQNNPQSEQKFAPKPPVATQAPGVTLSDHPDVTVVQTGGQQSDGEVPDTLHIPKPSAGAAENSQTEDPSLDEIYIDLRGTLHHRAEDDEADKADKTDKKASGDQAS
jgi:hypothetical protein